MEAGSIHPSLIKLAPLARAQGLSRAPEIPPEDPRDALRLEAAPENKPAALRPYVDRIQNYAERFRQRRGDEMIDLHEQGHLAGFNLAGNHDLEPRMARPRLRPERELNFLVDDVRPARAMVGAVGILELLEALAKREIPEADKSLKSWSEAPERTTTKLDFHWTRTDQATFRSKAAEMEARLADPEATEVARYRLGGGVNGTYVVVLSNGAVGVWKPVERESQQKLRSQVEEDHQGRREVGAYMVDQAMGHLARVPPAVFRKLGEQEGALLAYVPDAATAKLSPTSGAVLSDPSQPGYRRLAVFDHTIGNLDRHRSNWMVITEAAEPSPTEAANPVPIDHGLCFPLKHGQKGGNFNVSRQVDLGDEERAGLQGLMAHRETLTAGLQALDIKPEAIDAMYERAQTMLDLGKTTNAWRGLKDGSEAELEERLAQMEKMIGMFMLGAFDPMVGMGMMEKLLERPVHPKKVLLDVGADDKQGFDDAIKRLREDDRLKDVRLQIVLDNGDRAAQQLAGRAARRADGQKMDDFFARFIREDDPPEKNGGG